MNRYRDWLPRESLGEKVKRLRLEKRMTCRDFIPFGVSASTVSRIESGKEPTLGAVVAIAKALNVEVIDLLAGVELDQFLPSGGYSRKE